jgi:hypothetical protein
MYKSSDGINSSRKLSRNSYSASDSSLDDLNDEKEKSELVRNDSTPKRRRSQRSKSSSHHRNKNEPQSNSNSLYYARKDHSTSDSGQRGTLYLPLKNNSLRHIASDAAIYTISALRRQNDSQSSELNDIRLTSPQADSGSSSDFNRSPRESADSEMLGIRKLNLKKHIHKKNKKMKWSCKKVTTNFFNQIKIIKIFLNVLKYLMCF